MHAERTDTSTALRDFIRWYDQALPAEFCAQLIAGFEQMTEAQVINGRGVRAGLEGSRWTELNMSQFADASMVNFFRGQIDFYLERYNHEVALGLPIPPSRSISELVMKRYACGKDEGFQPHFDAMYDKANRYMVLLWYLNDVEQGGQTRFTDLELNVDARCGRLLMVPPYWMYQHAGLPPISNDKYILSTYLLFDGKVDDLLLRR